MLASLLRGIGTDAKQQIFVDANPDRFAYILDWYRHGEMFVPRESVEVVLRDARFFRLPDILKINGVSVALTPANVRIQDILREKTVEKWRGFAAYVKHIQQEIIANAEMLAQRSDEVDFDFFDQHADGTSEAASTHPSRAATSPRRRRHP